MQDGPQGVGDLQKGVTCWPSALTVAASWYVQGVREKRRKEEVETIEELKKGGRGKGRSRIKSINYNQQGHRACVRVSSRLLFVLNFMFPFIVFHI